MSSAEAEYMAACHAAMTAAVIRSMLYDIRYLGTKHYQHYESTIKFPPIILCVDNAAAVAMSTSPKLTKKTRHIQRHFHFVREGHNRGLHRLLWIPNTAQLADVLTKTQMDSKTRPAVELFMYQLPPFLVSATAPSTEPPTPPTVKPSRTQEGVLELESESDSHDSRTIDQDSVDVRQDCHGPPADPGMPKSKASGKQIRARDHPFTVRRSSNCTSSPVHLSSH